MSVLSGTKRSLPRARSAAHGEPISLRPSPVESAPDMAGAAAGSGELKGGRVAPMPPVAAGEYASAAVRQAVRRERAERRTAVSAAVGGFRCCAAARRDLLRWGALKADQLIAEKLIWPTSGAQFVEVGPRPDDPSATGGPMMIVVAGLNRKSGTGVADALMPSLAVDHTRVFSLVYGSGINDQDILDKFDALMTQYQPSRGQLLRQQHGRRRRAQPGRARAGGSRRLPAGPAGRSADRRRSTRAGAGAGRHRSRHAAPGRRCRAATGRATRGPAGAGSAGRGRLTPAPAAAGPAEASRLRPGRLTAVPAAAVSADTPRRLRAGTPASDAGSRRLGRRPARLPCRRPGSARSTSTARRWAPTTSGIPAAPRRTSSPVSPRRSTPRAASPSG